LIDGYDEQHVTARLCLCATVRGVNSSKITTYNSDQQIKPTTCSGGYSCSLMHWPCT